MRSVNRGPLHQKPHDHTAVKPVANSGARVDRRHVASKGQCQRRADLPAASVPRRRPLRMLGEPCAGRLFGQYVQAERRNRLPQRDLDPGELRFQGQPLGLRQQRQLWLHD